MKLEFQKRGGLAAQQHPLHEDLEILTDLAVFRVNLQLQIDGRSGLIDQQFGAFDRIIDPVVNVVVPGSLILHPAAPNVGFVRQDQRRGDLAHRHAAPLIMVSDGSDDRGNIRRRDPHFIQQVEGHHGPGLTVVDAVNDVPDVVHPRGRQRQVDRVIIRPQSI